MNRKTSLVLFFFKAAIFSSLAFAFYEVYFTEIVQKYAKEYTYLHVSQETMDTKIKPPFLTLCMTPRAKMSILEKYNMSLGSLNEPNPDETIILANLNKTLEELFREATFKLNVDYFLNISLWFYEEFGWKSYEKEILEGNNNFIIVGDTTYQIIVKELPTFYTGMCYVIEYKYLFNANQQLPEMAVIIEKKDLDIDSVKVSMTSDFEYIEAMHDSPPDILPFKFNVPFERRSGTQITAIETVIRPLICDESHVEYVSQQQCLGNHFFSEAFSPCPLKCLPLQLKGFKYLNISSKVPNCIKLQDEICNGGPVVWDPLEDTFSKCLKPCKFSTYINSNIELMELTYVKPSQTMAQFHIIFNQLRKVEEERLVYDTTDMIASIGGFLGLFLGFSFFEAFSKCLDIFVHLLNVKL